MSSASGRGILAGPGGPARRSNWPRPVQTALRGQWSLLRSDLSDPLARNGYALIANSAATGALGLVYWLLMARMYPTADVGRASAIYVAMNLLAGFTAMNFNGALNRFIPQAGLMTRTLVNRAYLVSGLASVVVAVIFVLSVGWWGPTYAPLGGPLAGPVFVASTVLWAFFTLQDGVLVGLRSASWVLVENALFGLVKIALLVALFAVMPRPTGIYASWMLPVVVAVPLVNVVIYRQLIPRHEALTCDAPILSNRDIGSFLAWDYFGALCLLATGSLVPVVVAAQLDVRQAAYFYMAWFIAVFADAIGINMGMSLTVEGAFDRSTLAVCSRKALRKMFTLLVPCAAAVAILAPWGLSLFGHQYAVHGAPVLELLAIATLPRAITEIYLGALRAQSRTSMVAAVQAARAVLMIGLAAILTSHMGAVGAAVAVVATQVVVAAVITVGLWRILVGDRIKGAPAGIGTAAR